MIGGNIVIIKNIKNLEKNIIDEILNIKSDDIRIIIGKINEIKFYKGV